MLLSKLLLGVLAQELEPHVLVLLKILNSGVVFLLQSLIYLLQKLVFQLGPLDLLIQVFLLLLWDVSIVSRLSSKLFRHVANKILKYYN